MKGHLMNHENFVQKYPDIDEFNLKLEGLIKEILQDFNNRSVKLFDLPAHKRIFLFIFTRALKSYSAILVLCRNGYGQDTAMLLRFLLENLITARYILRDPGGADELTRRFVAYKWVIFQRSLQEDERRIWKASPGERDSFLEKKKLIFQNVEEFKKNYKVQSDRALLTWSGATIRDMAKAIGADLLDEYEHTFRLCSRFSHPSILGDQEYMMMDDQRLVFSARPSDIGIIINLRKMFQYVLDYLRLVENLFDFGKLERIEELAALHKGIFDGYNAKEKPAAPKNDAAAVRESIVAFDVPD